MTEHELSEALEGLRHGNPPSDHIPQFSSVEEEFADVIIRIMDHARARGFRVEMSKYVTFDVWDKWWWIGRLAILIRRCPAVREMGWPRYVAIRGRGGHRRLFGPFYWLVNDYRPKKRRTFWSIGNPPRPRSTKSHSTPPDHTNTAERSSEPTAMSFFLNVSGWYRGDGWQGWAMKAGPYLRLVMRRSVFPMEIREQAKFSHPIP